MKSDLKQLFEEVRMVRRDLEEIKMILVPEVTPTKEEMKAIEEGRREYTRGEFEEWKEVRKRAIR